MHRRALLAVALAALACGPVALAQQPATDTSTRNPVPGPRSLKVLTFNIHHAEGEDGTLDVPRVAQVIRDSAADIVALQEVDRGAERTARRDLLKEIADLAGLRFAFGKNIDLQGGDYGNAVLTRFPIVSEGNRLLPLVDGGEQRGVLQVVLDVEGTQVLVLATHFDHRRADAQRVASAEAMLAMLQAWGDRPAIALGDFNDVPGSATYHTLTAGDRVPGAGFGNTEGRAGSPSPANTTQSGLVDVWAAVGKGDGFTIPVAAPTKRIDWILVRGLVPESAEVLKTDASDHLPVLGVVKTR
jgi:endonuclease/exonuclease/phosphatase family metal-dependent hydrolase